MNQKTVALILAVDERNWLGKANTLAWRLKWDMEYFREITTTTLASNKQNAVIMGRRTWESIPPKFRPLSGRKNYILTRDESFQWADWVFHSLEEALETLEKDDSLETLYIIGGAQIYNEAIQKDVADTIYLTQIFWDFNCDVSFVWVPDNYVLESFSEKKEENGTAYKFLVYQKEHDKKALTQGKTLWETEAPSISQVSNDW